MAIKLLEPSRYNELRSFTEFTPDTLPNPDNSIVVVNEDENGTILDFWVAQTVVHIEPVKIRSNDGGHTLLQMLATLLATLNERGVNTFFAFADNETVLNYLLRLGLVPLPYMVCQGQTPTLTGVKECPSSPPSLVQP